MQNLASAGAGSLHDGQRRSSALPQDMQNEACGGFSVPQLLQTRPAIPNRYRPGPNAGKEETIGDSKIALCADTHALTRGAAAFTGAEGKPPLP
jgi:hypothetical protein